MNKRIIEDWFPIEEVGEEGRKEKKTSTGRISSIHHWLARRPTCAMRAIALESLLEVPTDKKEYENIKNFIIKYCKNKVPNIVVLNLKEMAKEIKVEAYLRSLFKDQKNFDVKVLDPFAGGGAIPYEFSQIGCQTYATELNPVALLINKGTVEYLIKFRNNLNEIDKLIKKYAKLILNKIYEEFGEYYQNPINNDNQILFYVWAWIFPCKNEKCNLRIPMFKSLKLKKEKNWAIYCNIPKIEEGNEIKYSINWPEDEKLLNGFFKGGSITCPRCGTTIPKEDVHQYFKSNEVDEKIIVIYEIDRNNEIQCRVATEEDNKLFQKILSLKVDKEPELRMPEKVWLWAAQTYGLKDFKEMFNRRQLLLNIFLSRKIREIFPVIVKEHGKDIAKVIVLFLQFGMDKLINNSSKYAMIHGTRIRATWSRPGLFMPGNYLEVNPFTPDNYAGSWMRYFKELSKIFQNHLDHPYYNPKQYIPKVIQMDAQKLDFEDNLFDIILTDPPYYDSIPYAADADYFYLWNKSTLYDIFPDLFIEDETPKEEELIADPYLRGNKKKAKEFYENGLSNAFSEFYRVLKSNGIAVIIFANKKTEAWETLIQAFIKSKFVITATWPVPMESRGKLAAITSASLSSVIIIVARKIDKEEEVYFDKKFQKKIIDDIYFKMNRFWLEGIRGVDFFMCAIGPSLTHYSKYDRLIDPKTDKDIDIKTYMNFIQNVMVNFAVHRIAKTISTNEIDKLTQFYLVWRWGYGLNILPFDEIKKLYQALTIEMSDLEGKIIEKKKGKAEYKCLNPNDRFKNVSSKLIENFNSENMIDFLQLSCYLWENDSRELLESIINKALLRFSDSFWIIAQALYDILPECQEATQLQGILQRYKKFRASEKRIKEKKSKQTQLPI